jgi:sporulation protein YlmC with PRC-barrel domain
MKPMRHTLKLSALTIVAALAVTPAMAQTGATHSTMTAPATGRVGNTDSTTPADRNGVMTQAGEARASKVVGSSVYNDHDEKVGSVNDLLIAKDGKLSAVLSVGGFLGVGTKYVEVPYSSLTFGNTQRDSENRVVLNGATKDSLKSQAAYTYYKS